MVKRLVEERLLVRVEPFVRFEVRTRKRKHDLWILVGEASSSIDSAVDGSVDQFVHEHRGDAVEE